MSVLYSNRKIVLDIETTGINKLGLHYEGHRIIEIGAVEIVDRKLTKNYFHTYLQPNRRIDIEAFKIHGISNEFLKNKPVFSDIKEDFINFIKDTEIIIHNAPFDVGFINYELKMLDKNITKLETFCQITDSLQIARKMFPRKLNSLSALCHRYSIDDSNRVMHSALLDAKILAKIFLLMTGGQTSIIFIDDEKKEQNLNSNKEIRINSKNRNPLKIIYAKDKEIQSHENLLKVIEEKSKSSVWKNRRIF